MTTYFYKKDKSYNGIITLTNNYIYKGDILDSSAHGYGIFLYNNQDEYRGDCKFGKPDGYGVYTYIHKAKYSGYFSNGKKHGIGSYEDKVNVYKGSYVNNKKHGIFRKTNKLKFTTELQKWLNNVLIEYKKIQYIRPEALIVIKANPKNTVKLYQKQFKIDSNKLCIGCCDKPIDSVNDMCGHVVMCFNCLNKCDKCPICRINIGSIIKLYVN